MRSIIIGLFLIQTSFLFSQAEYSKIELLTNNFMTDMSKQKKLNNYVIGSQGKIVNYFLVSQYKITVIKEDNVIIEIDHGKGKYCTKIHLTVVLINGDYKIQTYPNENPNLVNPWNMKEKICK